MSISVTIAPHRNSTSDMDRSRIPMRLLEVAQIMSDECDGDIPIHVLDDSGHEAAIIGGHQIEDDIELF